MLVAVRMLTGCVPISFGIAGRFEALAIKFLDPIFSHKGTVQIRTKLGTLDLDMRHQPQRFMAYCYYNLKRHYARSSLGRHIRKIHPGSTFVDVGANLGFYSLLAQEAGLKAICFEPEPQLAEYLERNRLVFGQVFPVALSDRVGELPLYYFPRNAGATSLIPTKWTRRASATVPVTSFSQLALGGKLGDPAKIALVKIDVEGAEADTVRGMVEFLSAGYRPDIWCEVRGNNTVRSQGSYALVRDALQEFGYLTLDAPETEAPGPAPADEILASRGDFDLLFRAQSVCSSAAAQPAAELARAR